MGYNTYTTTTLVNNIKLIAHVPVGNSTFTNDNLITLADRELQSPLVEQILSTRGGYYLTYEDYELAADGLYRIPSGAVGGALINVTLVSSTTIIPVNIIDQAEQFATNSPTSTSYGFFMIGNYIQILPTPQIGVVRVWYTKRTSALIATSAAAQITAISGSDVTVSSVPSSWAAGDLIDICGDQPPFNVLDQAEISSIAGTTITLNAAVDSLVEEGDWVALRDQTPVPQIPVEFRTLLEQRVAVKIYELQGYLDKMGAAEKKLKELEQSVFGMMTPRVKNQTKVINPINGGFLAGNVSRLTNFPASRS